MIIFDGISFAKQKEIDLTSRLIELKKTLSQKLVIAAVYFVEDEGSILYTKKKKEVAERIGMEYRQYQFSFKDDISKVIEQVHTLNQDEEVTGIIVQKPTRKKWSDWQEIPVERLLGAEDPYQWWWKSLVTQIKVEKDVDGLHPSTLEAIKDGTWREKGRVLPATVSAVLAILEEANRVGEVEKKQSIFDQEIVILGKSDILGMPLSDELINKGCSVEMIGSKELQQKVEQGKYLFDKRIIISATGRANLITGNMISEHSIVIDVGEPRGDVDFSTAVEKSTFITPVPGGVGPVTVISLLENGLTIFESSYKY